MSSLKENENNYKITDKKNIDEAVAAITAYSSKTEFSGLRKDDFLTAVEKPSHYQGIKITGKNGSMSFEAIEIIDSVLDNLNLSPSVSHAIGDSLKYILRCGKKASDNSTTTSIKNKAKQDLLKSSWYSKKAAELLD